MSFAAAALLALAANARCAAPAPAKAAVPPSVSTSTVRASTATVLSPSSIYTAEKLRDPFQKSGGSSLGAASSGGGSQAFNPEDFNIHNLSLRAVMKDSAADYALLSDKTLGMTFVLRKGKVYDAKNKPIPGVTGTINMKQKSASLITRDKDVQVLRLGEEEKE